MDNNADPDQHKITPKMKVLMKKYKDVLPKVLPEGLLPERPMDPKIELLLNI